MLLRRISEHVRTQNWTAVALDFVIVVMGVFMGIQLGNWNDARVFAASEKSYLAELKSEIRRNNDVVRARVAMMERVVEAGRSGHAFLTSGAPCSDDCWMLTVDMFHASQVMFAPASRTVYDQLQRLDLPRSDAIKEAMSGYYGLDASIAESFEDRPMFREYVRKAIPEAVQQSLWNVCHEMIGAAERLIVDCAKRADDEMTRPALETLRANPDVAAELNYWLGMHGLWIPVFKTMVVRGEETIAAIDAELGGGR
ncbi:MAG: hypothetical protein GC152_12630 [Alphaproteobacteria bacterium]|nr:hypothetical protein [Alphaproteobacteria bacterium]